MSNNQLEEARRLVATDDRKDFDFATRGFIATRKDPVIRRPDGRVAVDLASYDFLNGDAAATANPSLWRQAQILTKPGDHDLLVGSLTGKKNLVVVEALLKKTSRLIGHGEPRP